MPTFERMPTSTELFELKQELFMLETEQELLGANHRERIEEIRLLLAEAKDSE